MTCDRCKRETNEVDLSMFNTEDICIVCRNREQRHKDYGKALDAGIEAMANGNFYFDGIGKPDDL